MGLWSKIFSSNKDTTNESNYTKNDAKSKCNHDYGDRLWKLGSDDYGGYQYATCIHCQHIQYKSVLPEHERAPSNELHTKLLNQYGPGRYRLPDTM